MSCVVIALSLMLLIYPAITICAVVMDSHLRKTGESRLVPMWFKSAAPRYLSWANTTWTTNYAQSIHDDDIPATEWPMFGSVFFLVTAEDLQKRGEIDATRGTIREAVEKAAQIVASPATATWVKTKWGTGYLEKENVFYRMLLILGLSSYEGITGSTQYRALMSRQRATLAEELGKANCTCGTTIPASVIRPICLWAVAAIQRAARLDGGRDDELAKSLIAAFDGPLKAPEGLPAFQADSRSGRILQGARGCGNSGLLLFAAELDPAFASRWYDAYEKELLEGHRLDCRFHGNAARSPDKLHGRRFRAGAVRDRLGFVGLWHWRGEDGRTDRPCRSADAGGGGLLVADALWIPDSRPDGPLGGQELESGRGRSAVLDDQTHFGGQNSSV